MGVPQGKSEELMARPACARAGVGTEVPSTAPVLHRELLMLAIIATAGLALRLLRIDAASYWGDELFSVYWVRQSLGYLWSAQAFEIETTPPLYYTLLKPWAAVFGS